MLNVIDLAIKLINEESVTPNDKNCQKIITEILLKVGFNVEHFEINGIKNIWATYGNCSPIFCFAGHTDVVLAGFGWQSNPFKAEIRQGMLYGRGASDMKGSLAATIIGTLNFIKKHNFDGTIAFLITADEEGDADFGTKAVVEILKNRNIHIDYCIVAEPSNEELLGDTIKNGRRGSINCNIKILGKQGHVAYPHLASNPINNALSALTEIKDFKWDTKTEFFDASSLQFVKLEASSSSSNVIPATLDASFNLRFSPQVSENIIKNTVENILNKHCLKYQIIWKLSGDPFLTKPALLVDSLTQAIKLITNVDTKLSTSGGTSDARFLAKICNEIAEFGAVNKTIHQANECVLVKDLEQLVLIYEKLLKLIFSKVIQ